MPRAARFGWIRSSQGIYVPLPAGTGAVEIITDHVYGFVQFLEKATYFTHVAGTGASASRTFRVLKGASTVVATATLVLADTDVLGEAKAFTVTDDGVTNKFDDTDLFTVDFASGGTAFTAGAGTLLLVWRSQPQAR